MRDLSPPEMQPLTAANASAVVWITAGPHVVSAMLHLKPSIDAHTIIFHDAATFVGYVVVLRNTHLTVRRHETMHVELCADQVFQLRFSTCVRLSPPTQ